MEYSLHESLEEQQILCDVVNLLLENDRLVSKHLPLSPTSMLEKLSDGLIFAKLINISKAETIEERRLNTNSKMTLYQRNENLKTVLAAAQRIGCSVAKITTLDITEHR